MECRAYLDRLEAQIVHRRAPRLAPLVPASTLPEEEAAAPDAALSTSREQAEASGRERLHHILIVEGWFECIAAGCVLDRAWSYRVNACRPMQREWEQGVLSVEGQTQDDFQIPGSIQSPENWQSAVSCLTGLAACAPHAEGAHLGCMLRAVVGTVHAIHRDVAARCKSFGGDELLPVLLYVVSKVRISHLVAAVAFLQEALSEKLLEGEGFESSNGFLRCNV